MASHPIATFPAKGPVILPRTMREQLRWQAGTRLVAEQTAGGVLLSRLTATFAPTRPEDVFGCLPAADGPRSVEEMDAGIMKEARRRHAGA